MQKNKALRLAGFVGALCTTGALVGVGISGTGAYFTDSKTGQINTSTGGVHINTTDTTLSYTDLLPGTYKTQQVNYQATGTGPEDIWLIVPTDGTANALGQPANPSALGRYGHFALTSNAGTFASNNLSGGTDQCPVDGDGHGGSNDLATFDHQGGTLSALPYCAVPNAILLDRNVAPGAGGSFSIEFGYTRVLRSGQDAGLSKLANYKIVATQAGVRPDDPNNPAGTN